MTFCQGIGNYFFLLVMADFFPLVFADLIPADVRRFIFPQMCADLIPADVRRFIFPQMCADFGSFLATSSLTAQYILFPEILADFPR